MNLARFALLISFLLSAVAPCEAEICRTFVSRKKIFASAEAARRAMADARERIERRYPTGNVIVTSADRGPYTFSIDILPSKEKKCPEIDEEMAKFDYTSYELAVGAMSQQIVETLAKKPDAIYIDTFLYCRDQTHCRYSFALLY